MQPQISQLSLTYGQQPNTTPSVQYAYDTLDKGARIKSMTYPNGRELHCGYANGLDDTIGRLSFLADGNGIGGIGQQVESYKYLGLGTVVERAQPQAGTKLSYIKLTNEANGDAGDQYTGLDRFGRVVDPRWLNSTNTNLDRYGYKR